MLQSCSRDPTQCLDSFDALTEDKYHWDLTEGMLYLCCKCFPRSLVSQIQLNCHAIHPMCSIDLVENADVHNGFHNGLVELRCIAAQVLGWYRLAILPLHWGNDPSFINKRKTSGWTREHQFCTNTTITVYDQAHLSIESESSDSFDSNKNLTGTKASIEMPRLCCKGSFSTSSKSEPPLPHSVWTHQIPETLWHTTSI